MISQPFDVVTVPDFSGPQARLFELRSLFFLAFWLEYAGACQHFPLHLACIGPPPLSVQRLAAQARARVTVHQPVRANDGYTINKARGFEVDPQTDHLLLLDTDFLVLGDFSELAQLRGCVAAALAHSAKVPEPYWHQIYPLLGMALPTERVIVLRRKISYSTEALEGPKRREITSAPYYNGGMVFLPWDCPLPQLWVEHVERIANYFRTRPNSAINSVIKSDMAGLATAIEQIKQQGVPFKLLPDSLHAHWLHLQGGLLSFRHIKLFHFTGLFKATGTTMTATHQRLHLGAIWLYQNLRDTLERRAKRQCYYKPGRRRNLHKVIWAILALTYRQQKLYNKYIVPVLK